MSMSEQDPRMVRIRKAVALEQADKVPFVLEAVAWAARVQGVTIGDFSHDPILSADTQIKAFQRLGHADASEFLGFDPELLATLWLTKIQVPAPGVDEPWQVLESGLLQPEDYDRILEAGWFPFYATYLNERIDGALDKLMAFGGLTPQFLGMAAEASVPVLMGASLTIPFEYLCGGRSFSKFVFDLYRMPDKIEQVMQAMMPGLCDGPLQMVQAFGFPAVWVGGWRSASKMLSPALWDRFVWPYFVPVIRQVADAGIIPILHFDSDWTRDLARFKDLPGGKCILSLDGMTNIREAKRVLGDHMCIMGDVPPGLLSTGTPEAVREYCDKLIADMGSGFILNSGCDVPIDAPLANVQAMVDAAAATVG